jgi:hypothetical protein
MFLGILSSWAVAASCPNEKLQIHRLPLDLNDTPYLKTIMGFSYGPEVDRFIPELAGAASQIHYVGSKKNVKVTVFMAIYRTESAAESAYGHLKMKWTDSRYQDVFRLDRRVLFFGNNKLTPECFTTIVVAAKKTLTK